MKLSKGPEAAIKVGISRSNGPARFTSEKSPETKERDEKEASFISFGVRWGLWVKWDGLYGRPKEESPAF